MKIILCTFTLFFLLIIIFCYCSVLNLKYRSQVESVYLTTESANLKKSHGEFGDKFRLLFQNICLFDAGTLIFNGTTIQSVELALKTNEFFTLIVDTTAEQLKMYLLRTLVTDLVNLTIGYYAHVPNASQMTPKVYCLSFCLIKCFFFIFCLLLRSGMQQLKKCLHLRSKVFRN